MLKGRNWGIVLLLFFVNGIVFAQNKLELFESEIDSLAAQNYTVSSFSFQSDSNWVVSYAENGFAASALDSAELNELIDMNTNGEQITQILKTDDFFLIVYNGLYSCLQCPETLIKNLNLIEDNNETIYNIWVENDAFCILHDNFKFTTNNPTNDLVAKLLNIKDKNLRIKQIILLDKAWIVSYGKAGIAAQNISPELFNQLNNLAKAGHQINFIQHIGSTWYVVYNGNQLKKVSL